jgi:hypothetical protein
MMFYIFVMKKIMIVKLIKIIFDHVMLKYDTSKNVVLNKEFVFITRRNDVNWCDFRFKNSHQTELNFSDSNDFDVNFTVGF